MSERDKKSSDVRCLCDEQILDQILLRGERTVAKVVARKRRGGTWAVKVLLCATCCCVSVMCVRKWNVHNLLLEFWENNLFFHVNNK